MSIHESRQGYGPTEARHDSGINGADAEPDGAVAGDAAAGTQEAIEAALTYVYAQKSVFEGRLEVLRNEARLAAVRLMFAALGIIAAVVLVLSAWVMLMVAIAEMTGELLAIPGLNVLAIALLNIVAAVVLYALSSRLLARAFSLRPFKDLAS